MFRFGIFVSLFKYYYYSLIKCVCVCLIACQFGYAIIKSNGDEDFSRLFPFPNNANRNKNHFYNSLARIHGKYLAIKFLLYCFNWRQMFTRAYNIACASICSCNQYSEWWKTWNAIGAIWVNIFSSSMNPRGKVSLFFHHQALMQKWVDWILAKYFDSGAYTNNRYQYSKTNVFGCAW